MRTSTLLILDDDAKDANRIAWEARTLGFEVRIVADAQRFIEAFLAERPAYLAIDIVMPDINAEALLQTLAQHDCQAAIILTSGVGTDRLPAIQLAAVKHELNIRGILQQPLHQHILRNLLSNQASVDLHAHTGGAISTQSFIVDTNTIHAAIHNHQFVVFYQPQIELRSGKVMGFEAFIRWQHPVLGIKLPELFIPIAEQTGQIDQLTAMMVKTGVDFISSLDTTLSCSLNLPVQSIKDDLFANTLVSACQACDLAPARVTLELTETAAMHVSAETQQTLTQLSAAGFKLSIDDFGNGNSSIAQLTQLPFSELKIDNALVTAMERSPTSRKVVASTLKLAESLGLRTIAVGIENTLTAIGLRELGCHYGQGYYFARPMDQDTTVHWLQQWNRQLHAA